jgi:DNA-binding NarL/FixJ family response regulator
VTKKSKTYAGEKFLLAKSGMGRIDNLERALKILTDKMNALTAAKAVGRPLAATDDQITEILKLRKAGLSDYRIAEQLKLGRQTVRTTLAKTSRTKRKAK